MGTNSSPYWIESREEASKQRAKLLPNAIKKPSKQTEVSSQFTKRDRKTPSEKTN